MNFSCKVKRRHSENLTQTIINYIYITMRRIVLMDHVGSINIYIYIYFCQRYGHMLPITLTPSEPWTSVTSALEAVEISEWLPGMIRKGLVGLKMELG